MRRSPLKTEYRIAQIDTFTFFAESRCEERRFFFWKRWKRWIYVKGTARGTLEQCREALRQKLYPPPKRAPEYIYHDAQLPY